MLITEQALFKMPQDRELQFPAMAVLQSYVNSYDEKMKANDVSQGMASYRLFYQIEGMWEEDWKFFQRAGIKLVDPPRIIQQADMVFDLSENRLQAMSGSGKHVCQLYGVVTGVGCPPWPILRQLKLKIAGDNVWGVADGLWYLTDSVLKQADRVVPVEESDLLSAIESKWTGIIGVASRLTYLACAMGVPVIEILPEGRDVNYLSKFGWKMYRVIEHMDNLEAKVMGAVKNIQDVCRYLATKEMYARAQKATT